MTLPLLDPFVLGLASAILWWIFRRRRWKPLFALAVISSVILGLLLYSIALFDLASYLPARFATLDPAANEAWTQAMLFVGSGWSLLTFVVALSGAIISGFAARIRKPNHVLEGTAR